MTCAAQGPDGVMAHAREDSASSSLDAAPSPPRRLSSMSRGHPTSAPARGSPSGKQSNSQRIQRVFLIPACSPGRSCTYCTSTITYPGGPHTWDSPPATPAVPLQICSFPRHWLTGLPRPLFFVKCRDFSSFLDIRFRPSCPSSRSRTVDNSMTRGLLNPAATMRAPDLRDSWKTSRRMLRIRK